MRTDTEILIRALRVLANDIESEDGVANAAVAEAAERLEELHKENHALRGHGVGPLEALSGHTGGEWKIEEVFDDNGMRSVILRPSNAFIYIGGRGCSDEEVDANARLVAAAPWMLSLLLGIKGSLCQGHSLDKEGSLT